MDGDFLRVYAITSAGCSTTIVQQQITKVEPPSFFIETDKAGNAICSGELITITASLTTALVGTTTYTYYIGGALVAQTNTASISTNSITVDTLVRIEVQSSSGCTSTRSLTVLVPQLASTGSITLSDASDVLICKGGDPSVINGDNSGSSRVASVTNGSISYQWFYKTDSMADYLETGTGAAHTGENYDPGTLNQTTTFVRRAYARIGSSTCDDANSNPITIQVDDERTPLIKVGGIPITSLSVCEEEVTSFTADGFVGTDSFTWFINASLVATQTVNYQVASGTFNDGDRLRLVIETPIGCATETIVNISVPAAPTINLTSNAPVAHAICTDENITFTVNEVSGAQYYWSKYSTSTPTLDPLAGSPTSTNSITVPTNNLADGDIITVTVSYTSACSVTDSLTVNILNLDPGSINTTPSPQVVCGTEIPSTISNNVSATTNSGVISYEWEYSTDGGTNWVGTGVTSFSYQFGGPIGESRLYRRVAYLSFAGAPMCSEPAPQTYSIVVNNIEGGSFTVATASQCFDIGSSAPVISVTGASLGEYQWQVATATFQWQDIGDANNATFEPTITSTETLYYRRITSNAAGTCSDTTSNFFTLAINDISAGSLDISPSGVYCNGEQPRALGEGLSTNGNSEFGAVSYTWEYKIDGTLGNYIEITGENSRNYQPPPLFANPSDQVTRYLYRRKTYDSSATGCIAISNVVTITIAPEILHGDLTVNDPNPLNYFVCEGDIPAELILLNATAPEASVVTYTWEESIDGISWSEVASSTSNVTLSFGTSNTPTRTTFYRVKITSGSTTPTPTTLSPSLNILLTPTSESISFGEIYRIMIDGNTTQVETSATISTTDQIGSALAAAINNVASGIPGYNAQYYPDENIIVIDNYSNNVGITLTPSPTQFLDVQILSRSASDDFCTVYSNVFELVVNETFQINQVSGPATSQIVCVNNAIQTAEFEVVGDYDEVKIRNLNAVYEVNPIGTGGASYSGGEWTVSGTTRFSITGTPTTLAHSSLSVEIRGYGPCDDENLDLVTMNYSIEVNDGPATPDIIYRNNPFRSRELNERFQIFQNDGDWYNNTVCQDDPDVDPDNPEVTYQFAACYTNNTDLRYIRFDWNVSPTSAVKSMTFMNDGDTNMMALISVNNHSGSTSFTNGKVYTITITGPDGVTTDTEIYTTPTPTLNYNDLVDNIELSFEALNFVTAQRIGNDIRVTADTAGEAGYFSLQIENAASGEFLLGDVQYLYPNQNNAVNIVFNPNFGTTTPQTNGVTATLRVRAESIYCDDSFSNWYEVELYVVSEQNPVASLPTLRSPAPLTRTYCNGTQNGIPGQFDANSDEVPDCELDLNFDDLYTTFYSASVSGSFNDFGYLEWKISNYDPSSSGVTAPGQNYQWNGGIDPEYGTVRWNPGFYGQFDVCVRAVSCDGTWDANGDNVSDDDEGWVCNTYTINPQSALPNIYAVGIPTCPIPLTGTVTSLFTSDQLVDWEIEPVIARNNTSTSTISGRDAFTVEWNPGFSGTAWIKATSKTCSSDPRYFTIRIPEEAQITKPASTTMPQSICQGDEIDPMIFNVSGYSVTGIDASSLPVGLTASYTTSVQTATIRITPRNLFVDDSDNSYIVSIDYVDYIYEADNTETLGELTNSLAALIEGSSKVASATAVTLNNSSTITISGINKGERFHISSNTPDVSKYWIGQPTIENFNGILTISGNLSNTLSETDSSFTGYVGAGPEQVHSFVISTTSASAECVLNYDIIFHYSPNHKIETTTPTLLTQEVCDGVRLEDIDFILSQGATDYLQPEWFPSEPNGIVFVPEFGNVVGQTTFTLSGTINVDVTTTTLYYYYLTTDSANICSTDSISGTLVVHPEEKLTRITGSVTTTLCTLTDTYTLQYRFVGIGPPTITATETFNQLVGFSTSVSYTTESPSVELTVVATATQINEIYQIEIVEPDGQASAYLYTAPLGTESPTHIAEQLVLDINNRSTILTASSTGAVITIEANNPDFVFWVRINPPDNDGNILSGQVETYRERRMLVTDAIPVEGVFTITGIPSVTLTEQASYTFGITTTGERCTSSIETVTIILNEPQAITLTSTSTAQEICEGEPIDNITFMLTGAATGYTLEWGTGTPGGITFSPTMAQFPTAGTQTLTLSGTPTTDASTTTVYYYTLTTLSTDPDACQTDSISGTIVVHPNNELIRTSGSVTTTLCTLTDTYTVEYRFTGINVPSVTSTATFNELAGLSTSVSYTTASPSVELTVVATATQVNEIYQIDII